MERIESSVRIDVGNRPTLRRGVDRLVTDYSVMRIGSEETEIDGLALIGYERLEHTKELVVVAGLQVGITDDGLS